MEETLAANVNSLATNEYCFVTNENTLERNRVVRLGDAVGYLNLMFLSDGLRDFASASCLMIVSAALVMTWFLRTLCSVAGLVWRRANRMALII